MPELPEVETARRGLRWEYGYSREAGSDAARLAEYLRPRDWLTQAGRSS